MPTLYSVLKSLLFAVEHGNGAQTWSDLKSQAHAALEEAAPLRGTSTLTPEKAAAYLANANHCPFCDSRNIEGESFDVEGDEAFQPITCSHCGAKWSDGYKLANLLVLYDPTDPLVPCPNCDGLGAVGCPLCHPTQGNASGVKGQVFKSVADEWNAPDPADDDREAIQPGDYRYFNGDGANDPH